MQVTAILHRNDTGAHVDNYTTEAPTWELCVRDIISWLRIEVFPYWAAGALRLTWPDDTDPQAAAALWAIARCYYLPGMDY